MVSKQVSNNQLNSSNHDRDAAGMTYIYPVVSRRAGGVSIGVNLNPNNACNWHCAYCQVPDLVRGVAPDIDLQLLRVELIRMLDDVIHGALMQQRVPETCQRLCDIAMSGNGEPTSCAAFDQVVATVIDVMQQFELQIPLRLITNGSYVHKPHVQRGLMQMANHHGEVWIKVDQVTDAGIARMNGITLHAQRLQQQIEAVASRCPTWIQTCMLAWDGQPPTEHEISAYIDFLRALKQHAIPVQGILLYGLARPSLQLESVHLSPLDTDWMNHLTARIEAAGFPVRLSI